MESTSLNFFINRSVPCIVLDKILDQDYEDLLIDSNLDSKLFRI